MSSDPPRGPDDGERPAPPNATATPEATPTDAETDDASQLRAARVVTLRESSDGDDASPIEGYDVESLPRGTQLGRYVLLGRLADRGAAEVLYGAYDPEADRKVTLKLFLPTETGGSDAATRAVLRQAQAVARLSHPCVEQIYEAGVYGPWVFLAAEFIDGIDLRHWMEARDEPFPWPEVLRVFREAGRGLAAAHKLGIVHRDFRPANVKLGKGGRLVVVDFGLASEVDEADDDIDYAELRDSLDALVASESLEDTGGRPSMTGTPAYLAPEQYLTGQADARSDQFAFCVALYEALYGERPFSGNRPRAIALEAAKHQVRAAPAGSGVPAWLRAIVLRGLSPRPEDRHASMEALLRELARDPAARRRRWMWGATLTAGLVGASGLVAMQLEKDDSVCAGEGEAVTGVWTTDRRETLHDAFVATHRDWAEPTWRYVETQLDAWAESWRDYAQRACEATRVWEDAAERTYQLRVHCLDRTLEGLDATLEVLATVDGAMLDRAHVLASTLPGPQQCLDTDTLLALGLPPEEQREAIEALHRELAGLETRLSLGDVAAVQRETLALEPRVAATGDAPLHARTELLLGRARLAARDDEAEATLHRAARTALGAGHPRLATHAWLARMDALTEGDRATEAAALGDYAQAVIEHKHFPWLRPALEIARGHAAWADGETARADAHFHAAIAHEDTRTDSDALRLLPAWLGLADVMVAHDDPDQALQSLQTALDVVRDALGPRHPAAIEVLRSLGLLQRRLGALASARDHLEQALEIARKSAPAGDDATVLALEIEVGELCAAEGDATAASQHFDRAYQGLGGDAAARRAEVFAVGLALARSYHALGNEANARSVLEGMIAARHDDRPRSPDEGEPASAEALHEATLLLANDRWNAGRADDAHALVSRTLAVLGDTAETSQLALGRWIEEHPLP